MSINVKYSDFIKERNEIEWTSDIQNSFEEWKEDGNVEEIEDGVYSTQDAQYKNKIKGIEDLKNYYYNEFIKPSL